MNNIAFTLSRRQWEFLKLLVFGMTDKQIAFYLYVSPYTVRNYMTNLFQCTGLHNRTQPALWGKQFLQK